ncbi:MAG: PKD domain-containing protein, partial [Melioribacteraceae bacterium]|nr:PKD domain-containing protein [Melioribacteraceae bacterium]
VQAEPEHALPGQPIKFEAIIEPFVGGVEYQFIFGNKKKSDWSFNSTAHHSYSEIGMHDVSVQIRRDNKIISVSEPIIIEIITTPPSENLYVIVGGVFIIIGGGYLLIKKLSGGKKIVKTPSYSIHINPEIDIGDQKIESNVQLNSNMGLRFKPVKDIGKQTIETEDSSIND